MYVCMYVCMYVLVCMILNNLSLIMYVCIALFYAQVVSSCFKNEKFCLSISCLYAVILNDLYERLIESFGFNNFVAYTHRSVLCLVTSTINDYLLLPIHLCFRWETWEKECCAFCFRIESERGAMSARSCVLVVVVVLCNCCELVVVM